MGVAAADLERIFEPLQRGANSQGQPGLGLGLAIARQWVQVLGGELNVVSRLGHGSEFAFVLDLPIVADASSASAGLGRKGVACCAASDELAAQPLDCCLDRLPNLTMPQAPLPASELAYFRQLLALGQVVRIQAWAGQFAERNAAYQPLMARIVTCCREANLLELSNLAKAMISEPEL